jgi:hypothetical protein
LFLSTSKPRAEVRPPDLDITDESLPTCKDDHLPDNAPTTAEEAEAMPDPPDSTECDASRGGTLNLCKDPPPTGRGMSTNCVMIGELTGPP